MLNFKKGLFRTFAVKYHHLSTKVGKVGLRRVYPPPGDDLVLPDWTVEKYLDKIGFGCIDHLDLFEGMDLEQVFHLQTVS